jgi:glucosylceramidase
VFHFSQTRDGQWTGTANSPDRADQGAADLPLDVFTLKDKTVHCEIRSIMGSFDGTLTGDGRGITGTWSQFGSQQPLNLSVAHAGTTSLAAVPVSCRSAVKMRGWITTERTAQRLAALHCAPQRKFASNDAAVVVHIDAAARRQTVIGFGAALTDATVEIIRGVPARGRLLRELFGRSPGLALRMVRVPIGATDFSRRHYSLDDVDPGESDPNLLHFNLDPDHVGTLALLKAVRAINPQLLIVASPWSAPAWMKSSGRLITGSLEPRFYDAYAHYLLRFAQEYRAAGLPIYAITVQNEPRFEPTNYPGMLFPAAARIEFLRDHLGPLLASVHDAPLVFDWDHNWIHAEEPQAVLEDRSAAAYLGGIAWHCYEGHMEAQVRLQREYPDVPFHLTECSGGDWEGGWAAAFRQMVAGLILPELRAGARSVMLWNLALDQHQGPHLGGCSNCRAVLTIDSRTGTVTRNPDYYALGHFSRFLGRDAVRIESSDESPAPAPIAHAAFVTSADDRVLVLFNQSLAPHTVRVREAGTAGVIAALDLPSIGLVTLVWPAPRVRKASP